MEKSIQKLLTINQMEVLMNMEKQRVVLLKPEMDDCIKKKDVTYKVIDDLKLKLDVYYPKDYNDTSLLPAVVFVHGEAPWEVLHNAKDWGQYKDWGKLIAASGMIGITFTRRSSEGFTCLEQASADIVDLFTYVVEHSKELGVNTDRLGLWVCSAGGPACLPKVLRNSRIQVRSVVALYTLMNLEHIKELHEFLDSTARAAFSPLTVLEDKPSDELPPMMIVRAGLDRPVFNNSIDDFVNKALKENINVVVINYPNGNHGFDVRDDNNTSRMIIERVLEFCREHLSLN